MRPSCCCLHLRFYGAPGQPTGGLQDGSRLAFAQLEQCVTLRGPHRRPGTSRIVRITSSRFARAISSLPGCAPRGTRPFQVLCTAGVITFRDGVDKDLQDTLERQAAQLALHQRQELHAIGRLQRRVFVQTGSAPCGPGRHASITMLIRPGRSIGPRRSEISSSRPSRTSSAIRSIRLALLSW